MVKTMAVQNGGQQGFDQTLKLSATASWPSKMMYFTENEMIMILVVKKRPKAIQH